MENIEVSNQRVFGATMLVAGSCIGAGMLGLPVLTALGGFKPTCILFVFSWLFMVVTGLLLLEVNLWFKGEVSFISMTGKTLGKVGQFFGWILFAFLFYSLMVAYVVGSGQLLSDFFGISEWLGSLLLSGLFGVFLYLGTSTVDGFNRILMIGLIFSYFVFIVFGSPHIDTRFLEHADWTAATFAIPAMIISFGFHNLVPSMTTYLNHDAKKLRFVIIVGSLIPLLIYLVWEWLVLGLVSVEGENGFRNALEQGDMATRVLRNAIGASWIADVVEYFAFFAIVTSFLGVSLSFVDFLADGLHVKKTAKGKVLLCFLSLAPPFFFAMAYPKIFLNALTYAGAYGAVILFGIMPALMVWSGRYFMDQKDHRQIPGGRVTLAIVIMISLTIVGCTLWR